MAFNLDELDLEAISKEDLVEAIKEIQKESVSEVSKAKASIERLQKKNQDLLKDQRKRKNIANIIEAAGLSLEEEDLEDKFKEIAVAAKQPQPADPAVPSSSDGSGQVSDETAALLKRMENQIDALKQANEQAEAERRAAIQARRSEKLDRVVLERLEAAGCKGKKAKHLLALTKDRYRYESDDSDRIVGGDEYDPVELDTVIGNLREDEEFQDYFLGSGNTGSGMAPSEVSMGALGLNNPFRAGGNLTEAATIIQTNPERARRLVAEARAAGKLDPAMAKLKI